MNGRPSMMLPQAGSTGSRLTLATSAGLGTRGSGHPGAATSPHHHDQHQQRQQQNAERDDAPMTPVVYLVLWTSVAVGALRGYAFNATVGARWSPSFNHAMIGRGHTTALAALEPSPYCNSGLDRQPNTWYETLLSIVPPACASILAAVFIRSQGRTRGVMLGCVVMIIGQILMASATGILQLAVANALVQCASNCLSLSIVMQTIEVAPRTVRGRFLLIHFVGISVGIVIVSVIGYVIAASTTLGWRLLLGMGVVPALAVLLVMPWMVDTPQSLIERRKYAEGLAALRDIRGPFYEDTYGEYMSIVTAAAAAPKGFAMYAELFRNRRYLPAICVGMVMALLAIQLDPQSRSYVAYNTLIKAHVAPEVAVLMTTCTLAVSYALGTLVSMWLVDRAGRLPLLRLSAVCSIAVIAVLAVSGFIYNEHHGTDVRTEVARTRDWPYLQLAALGVLSAANGLSWSSAVWVTICESQALAIRPAGMGLCLAVSNLSSSVLEAQLLCVLGVMYYVFVLCVSLVALAISFLFVPETCRVSLEDITDLYLHHWFWRRVVGSGKGGNSSSSGGGGGSGASGRHAHHVAPPAGSRYSSSVLSDHLPVVSRPPSSDGGSSSAALRPDGGPGCAWGGHVRGQPPPAAAAAASDLPPSGPGGGFARTLSPFGRKDVQLAAVAASAGGPTDGGAGAAAASRPGATTSAAVAAAAASAAAAAAALGIIGSGAVGAGASGQLQGGGGGRHISGGGGGGGGSGGGGSSSRLSTGWTLRGSGWFGGWRRSSQQLVEGSSDAIALDQLAHELQDEA